MQTKKFLFITHLTPAAKRSETRAGLMRLMQNSLLNQSYTNWKAIWIGEEESDDGKIKQIDCSSEGSLRNAYMRHDLKAMIDWADYIIKLDDDDIILPHTLETASRMDFDCYCDRFHTFYDLSTGKTTQQARPWIAATCIHKKEHAITLNKGGLDSWNTKMKKPQWHESSGVADNFIHSLFYGEHGSDWIRYYQTKKIVYASPTKPIYVRILSPTSISSGARKYPVNSFNDVDAVAYRSYISKFGSWNSYTILNWSAYPPQLKILWEKFSGAELLKPEKTPLILRIKEQVKYWKFRLTKQ